MNYPIRSEWHNPVTFGRRGRCLKLGIWYLVLCMLRGWALSALRLFLDPGLRSGARFSHRLIDPFSRGQIKRKTLNWKSKLERSATYFQLFCCDFVHILRFCAYSDDWTKTARMGCPHAKHDSYRLSVQTARNQLFKIAWSVPALLYSMWHVPTNRGFKQTPMIAQHGKGLHK